MLAIGARTPVGPSDNYILSVLTSTQAVTAAEAQSVIGWWRNEALEGESLPDFLVRREVLAPAVLETVEPSEDGRFTPGMPRKLFTDRGIDRLRKNLGLSERRPASPDLVSCLSRPPQRGRDSADLRTPHNSKRPTRMPAPAVRPGTLLGKYMVIEQVGRGASSIVFRGLHRSLNLPVAIKVLPNESDPDDPTVREHFRAEARLQARLDHPSIVRVLDFEDDAALAYLVLEFIDGSTLADRIAKSGCLPADQALKIVLQIAEALAAVHQLGVVHRDVKPGNILLTADGRRAKLADLGLALVVASAQAAGGMNSTARDTVVGTAAYIAPEQVMSSQVIDHRADIYSLGATLYHALTGQLPFTGRSRLEVLFKHTNEAPVSPDQLVPSLEPGVTAVVLKMMAKDPDARHQTYPELLSALRSLVRRPPITQPPGETAPAREEASSAITDSRSALSASAWRKLFPLRPPPAGMAAGRDS
jgi:serine/threonine protein kinase